MAVIVNGKGVEVEVPDEWLVDGTLDDVTPGWKPADQSVQKRRGRPPKVADSVSE